MPLNLHSIAPMNRPETTSSIRFLFSRNSRDDKTGHVSIAPLPAWRSGYWAYAALIPLALYSLEALKISLYHTARAPNAGLIAQLAIMTGCYGLWVLAPRLSWAALYRWSRRETLTHARAALYFAGLGVVMASLHLFCFTLAKLVLFAPYAWLWRPIHILHNYGEVWLGFGGLWLFAYIVTASVILLAAPCRREDHAPPARYEVKDNGKTFSIPLSDIYWIKAAGNYVEMHTVRGVTMVRKTLAAVEKEIGEAGFLKSHRSALINGRHVTAIKPMANSSGYVIELSNRGEAPLSRRRLSTFKAILKTVE